MHSQPTQSTRRQRRAAALASALCCGLLAAALAPLNAAAAAKSAIRSPRAGQTVKGTLLIRPKVLAKTGPFKVRVTIDGKLYNEQTLPDQNYARSPVPIDTTELKNGRHRLSVSVSGKSRPRRVSQTLRFTVRNTRPGPAGAGQPAPLANYENFKLAIAENFDRDAPTGSFTNTDDPWQPVYTGSSGTQWTTYPPAFLDTFLRHPYQPSKVLSVHNGVLDFSLQPVNGVTAGASLSPQLPNGSLYQTYGRYAARMRIGNAPVDKYHAVLLLWPQKDEDFEYCESDFPENQLKRGLEPATGYAHYGPNSTQEYIFSKPIDFREWHVYSQDWSPGQRRFYLDGELVYTARQNVWSGPMRWQVQVQSFGRNADQSGHLYVDWAAVWSYAPGTKAG
jgi:hypothetical protein